MSALVLGIPLELFMEHGCIYEMASTNVLYVWQDGVGLLVIFGGDGGGAHSQIRIFQGILHILGLDGWEYWCVNDTCI